MRGWRCGGAPLCWASRDRIGEATVAQLVAPGGGARSGLGLRETASPRWASQGLPNAATVAQLAAPRGARFSLDLYNTPLRWTSQEVTILATVAQLAALREGEVWFGCL